MEAKNEDLHKALPLEDPTHKARKGKKEVPKTRENSTLNFMSDPTIKKKVVHQFLCCKEHRTSINND